MRTAVILTLVPWALHTEISLWHYRTKENNYIESPNIQGGIAIDIYGYSKFNQGS